MRGRETEEEEGKRAGNCLLPLSAWGKRAHVCVWEGERERCTTEKRIEDGEKSAERREGAALVKRLSLSAVGRSVGSPSFPQWANLLKYAP